MQLEPTINEFGDCLMSLKRGDRIKITIRSKDEFNNLIGYLEDGSIVQVGNCSEIIGNELEVIVYFIYHGEFRREIMARLASSS
jgi:uncharacterized protein YacL